MDTLHSCILSQNDYDYVWFANKLFVIENETHLFQHYQNTLYIMIVVIAIISFTATYIYRLRKMPVKLTVISMGMLALLCWFGIHHYDKALAANEYQAQRVKERIMTYEQPKADILQLCVAGKEKPKAKLEFLISKNDTSSVEIKYL